MRSFAYQADNAIMEGVVPDKKIDERVVHDRRKATSLPSRPAVRVATGPDEERRTDRRADNLSGANRAGGALR